MKEKINVAHIFLSLRIGGMEKIGIDLVKNLDQSKYKHLVLCLDELGAFGEKLKNEGYPVFAFHKGDGFKFSLLPKLIRFFKKYNIQIVHTNNPSPHFWGGIAAWIAGVKIRIHTKHGRNFITIKRKVLINRFSARFSKKIISVSQDSAQLTHKIERVPLNKIKIIYNGVDTDYFKKEAVKESLYHELGIPRGSIVVGSISRFSTDKDYETLIKAFKEVLDTRPDTVLLLVGDGETKEQIMQLTADLQLQDKIIFSGFRPDILELLNFIDVFVLSTHTEGISIALLEAMSTEVPVVATNVGGNGEIVQHTKNGLLVAENDVADLKNAILTFLNDEEEKIRLSKEARKVVLQKFSLKNTVAQYEKLYSEFLNSK